MCSSDLMPSDKFSQDLASLRSIVEQVLARAKEKGATACEAEASEGYGSTVTVRRGDVETIEYNRDKGISVSVYIGRKKGYASTSDFSARAIADTTDAALSIARFTAEDEAAGLAEPGQLCRNAPDDLDLFHPWDIAVEDAVRMAKEAEAAAFRLDKRVINSEGASVSAQQHQFAMGNSLGFMGAMRTSRHYLSCSVIAGEGDQMQRDDWYASQRAPEDLPAPEAVGDYAGRRALARLRSRKISTRTAPVIFEAPIASGLIAQFVSAASGGNLYRKSSFLLDSLGKQVFSPVVSIAERPHVKRGQASGYFDDDGVVTRDREVVEKGILNGYFLGTYSARKLGMQTTGNAGGNHNLIVAPGNLDLVGLLRHMGTGLLVTELMGQGLNMVTGDYSRSEEHTSELQSH